MKVEASEELISFITPPDLCQAAEEAQNDLLPHSKRLYEKAYEAFNNWRADHETKFASESVMLTYFEELSNKYAPSSMWAKYSMIKTMINLKEKVDIGEYISVTALLKRKAEGFVSKKSNILTPEQINKFLTTAHDNNFLEVKVALIIGISGACRKLELTKLKLDDVRTEGNLYVIRLYQPKTKRPKFFTVGGEFTKFVRNYINLRPKNCTTDRFFLAMRGGKCINQVIGENTFAQYPKKVAQYLQLENPENYTGHSFRRSSATLVADSGANITTLKRLSDWKSAKVAEGYGESVKNKAKIGKMIESAINLPASSTSQETNDDQEKSQVVKRQRTENVINIGSTSSSTAVTSSRIAPIFKFENCTVTVNNYSCKKNG